MSADDTAIYADEKSEENLMNQVIGPTYTCFPGCPALQHLQPIIKGRKTDGERTPCRRTFVRILAKLAGIHTLVRSLTAVVTVRGTYYECRGDGKMQHRALQS
jgi:hypothetical protein